MPRSELTVGRLQGLHRLRREVEGGSWRGGWRAWSGRLTSVFPPLLRGARRSLLWTVGASLCAMGTQGDKPVISENSLGNTLRLEVFIAIVDFVRIPSVAE